MEAQWTKKICKGLIECGAMVFPIVASRMQPPGWPDRLVVHREWVGLIEFKGVDTIVRPVQIAVIRELRKRGKCVFIAREPGELWDLDVHVGDFTTSGELIDLILQYTR